jgi:hypothetical protein
MADSTFWRDLADQFRALPEEFALLRGDRHQTVGSDDPAQWELIGGISAKVHFEALARRAASAIPNPSSSDLLTAWLEALIQHADAEVDQKIIGTQHNPDGSVAGKRMTSSLYWLPASSVNYCKMLESEALQAEAEEKRRNDPKNWPRLRTEFEVFKSLRDMRSGPHEEIPEAFMRDSLLRQLGIKPEEVTWEQMRHAVSSLLPHYRAIRLMPTTGSQLDPHRDLRRKRKRKRKRKAGRTRKETVAEQIQRLRKECNLTVEQLAARVGLDVRNVTRHVSGQTKPRLSSLAEYERVFSEALDRKVTIDKTP